jgi:hypothetical protein
MVSDWRLMLVLIRIAARITLLYNVGSCLLLLSSITLLHVTSLLDFIGTESALLVCLQLVLSTCHWSGCLHMLVQLNEVILL